MKRDADTALMPTVRLPVRQGAHFFQLVDVIGETNEPTGAQLDALESSYLGTGTFLCELPVFNGLLDGIHAHGSRLLGTIIRPRLNSREGYDIDLVARFLPSAMATYGSGDGPARLLDDLHTGIAAYARRHGLKVTRYARCVTLEYADGMTADIAPVIDSRLLRATYGDTHGLIPDQTLQRFVGTNPRGYATYFKQAGDVHAVFGSDFSIALDSIREATIDPLPDANEVLGRLLCRLVQLVKLHRNAAFKTPGEGQIDLAPSSIFLTTLIAEAYKVAAPQFHNSPMELLLDVVERMDQHFQKSGPHGETGWYLPNPAVPNDNLAADMAGAARQQAYTLWHAKLTRDLVHILQAAEPGQGFDELLEAVGLAFGERAREAVLQHELGSAKDARAAGKTRLFVASVGGAGGVAATASTSSLAGATSAAAAVPRIAPTRPHTFYGR